VCIYTVVWDKIVPKSGDLGMPMTCAIFVVVDDTMITDKPGNPWCIFHFVNVSKVGFVVPSTTRKFDGSATVRTSTPTT